MKYAHHIFNIFLILALPNAATAREIPQEGAIPWIPYSLSKIEANAALDAENFPVVLYNSHALNTLFESVAHFRMVREETIALLAAEQVDAGLLTRKEIREEGGLRSAIGRYLLVDESLIYPVAQSALGDTKELKAGAALNCLAYFKLTPEQRMIFLKEYRQQEKLDGDISFGDLDHPVTYAELSDQMRSCNQYILRESKK
jgi:hypothetical protein